MKVILPKNNQHERMFKDVPKKGLFQVGGDVYFYIKILEYQGVNALSLSPGKMLHFGFERLVTYYPDAVIHAGEPE